MCFGSIDVGLGTASVNIIIGFNQVSGLLGGVLADRVLGMMHNIIITIALNLSSFTLWACEEGIMYAVVLIIMTLFATNCTNL